MLIKNIIKQIEQKSISFSDANNLIQTKYNIWIDIECQVINGITKYVGTVYDMEGDEKLTGVLYHNFKKDAWIEVLIGLNKLFNY